MSRPYREQTKYRVQVEDGLTEPVDIPADCGRTDGLVAWCDIQVAFICTTTWGQLGVFQCTLKALWQSGMKAIVSQS